MNVGDLNKVWEIRALKRKSAAEEATKMLEKIAKQVQPIMRKHKWRVKLLSEMCPSNPSLLGLNVGSGINVKLRLRRPNRDSEFYPFDQVLDTMLHELCHNAHGPHNANFDKLWDELRKECEELMAKGITGAGEGFDLPGRRLGGYSHQPPLSSLRKTALAAAAKRAQLGSLLPSGPKRLGGDSVIMKALSPVQAAAMAAERRLQDDIWCGSQSCENLDHGDYEVAENIVHKGENLGSSRQTDNSTLPSNLLSRKRSQDTGSSLPFNGSSSTPPEFVDLTTDTPKIRPVTEQQTGPKRRCGGSESIPHSQSNYQAGFSSGNLSSVSGRHCEESGMWECTMCTLLNKRLAPICELCGTQQPKDEKYKRLDKTGRQREIPDIKPGYFVQLKVEVPENKRRVSIIKGIVIARRNAGLKTTFRIRRQVAGFGIESLFPLCKIKEIKALDKKEARRDKLYYLRNKHYYLRDRMNALKN